MKNRFMVSLGLLMLFISAAAPAAYITDKLVAGLYKEAKVSDKPIKALNSGTPLEVIARENDFVKVRTSDGTIGYVEATYLTEEKPARSILLDTQARLSMLQKQLEQVKAKAENLSGSKDAADDPDWREKLTKAQGQISQLEIQLKAARLNNKKWEEDQQTVEQQKQQLIADLQAKSEAAMQALKQENQALREQISQVADILSIQVGAASQQAKDQTGKTGNVVEVFANDWFWILLVTGLIVGFAGGFYYMRHKVSKRFGTTMRF